MKKILLVVGSICCFFLTAQPNLDSLNQVWLNSSNKDSTRAMALEEYIRHGFLISRPDTAFYLAEKLIAFGKDKNIEKAISAGYNYLGIIWNDRNNFEKAIHYYSKSLKIDRQLGVKKGIARSLNNIGLIYETRADYNAALEYYNESLLIYEELEHVKGIAICYNNMGNVFFRQGLFEAALEYYKISLDKRKAINDQFGIATSLNNIGLIYEEEGDLDEALGYYEQSLKIGEEVEDKVAVVYYLSNIGNIYYLQKKYQKAIGFCERAYDLSMLINFFQGQDIACNCLYKTFKEQGNNKMALVYHELLGNIEDSLDLERTGLLLQQMEFDKALLQDSIANAEEARLVQQAHEEEMRAEEKQRNISLGIGGLVLILAGGLYSRLRYVRKTKATLQTEKDRSDNLLLNILPEEIAQELKEKGKADARDFELVSILFTDFKSFTEKSANLSAAELVAEINHCFEAFDGIIDKYGIEKIKTIGDAYMAAGGLPVPTDDSVKNTVLAALEMQRFIEERKKKKEERGESGFEMRVGIHTGPVVAGIVGVKKFQYDIWGDTVNTASRMESSGEVGKVNISQATYELLKNDPQFSFESRGKIEAKGKGEMEMYFVSLKQTNQQL